MITCCHLLSFVVTRCQLHLLSFVVTQCYTTTTRCHSLYQPLSFVITRCHSMSLVVTRCITRLYFYKRSIITDAL